MPRAVPAVASTVSTPDPREHGPHGQPPQALGVGAGGRGSRTAALTGGGSQTWLPPGALGVAGSVCSPAVSVSPGVYAFGFLFMLPQLFVNYKVKCIPACFCNWLLTPDS